MKKLLLIIILLLCACEKEKNCSCVKIDGDKQIYLDISSIYDDIVSVSIREAFVLPYSLLLDEYSSSYLKEQLDDTYHIENNMLIREYEVIPDDRCSLQLTLSELKKELFICE